MGTLAQINETAQDIEGEFEHKAILYIGSESYDAPTITLLHGLYDLGFKVYTIGKPNINCWHLGTTLLRETHVPEVDFVLSNLHWGTRWSYYAKYKLHDKPKVLIDGDDNPWGTTWRDKYNIYQGRYTDIGEGTKDQSFSPRRWIEPLGMYEPSIVFAGQNQPRQDTHYLPFGIMPEYTQMATTAPRDLFFLHVTGPGPFREDAHERITEHQWHNFPSIRTIESGSVRGKKTWPEWVPQKGRDERNVHSWHRWSLDRAYFDALSRTHILIYPGVSYNHWESKRPWEALACGCAVMMLKPNIDVSGYPHDELIPDQALIYSSPLTLMAQCEELIAREQEMDGLRKHITDVAYTYFTPVPIARYALRLIKESIE